MKYDFDKLLKIDPRLQTFKSVMRKCHATNGNWVVFTDFRYSKGLKANHLEYFWYKKEAEKFLKYISKINSFALEMKKNQV